MLCWHCWKLVISSAAEEPSGKILSNPAPLFEEEGDAGSTALRPDSLHPFRSHRSCTRARFPPDNDPVDSIEGEDLKWPDQRLTGEEPNAGRHGPQFMNAMQDILVFDADSHPNVFRP